MGIILTGKKFSIRQDRFFLSKLGLTKLDPNHPDLDGNILEKRLT